MQGLERNINDRLLQFLNASLLVDKQCGFQNSRSASKTHIHEAIAREHSLISIFLDKEKAYGMTWQYGNKNFWIIWKRLVLIKTSYPTEVFLSILHI